MKKLIFTFGLLFLTWILWPTNKVATKIEQNISTAIENKNTPVVQQQTVKEAAKREPTAALTSEAQSLETMGRTLGQVTQTSFTLKRLLEDLQKTGQQPLVAHDANPDTGEMLIVRTKSPLPGTRYFHAQYFTGDDGERFVQHMSFEYKPGPDAMAEAIAAVKNHFPNLSQPMVEREDYVKWTLDRDYIVWVKKMTMDELKHDPFNSYSTADNGTIRIAVELEVHGD